MIEFQSTTSNLAMKDQFSMISAFENISHYQQDYRDKYFLDKYNDALIVYDEIGNANKLSACTLLHYPALNKKLRNHKYYPTYKATIQLSDYRKGKEIKDIIKSLQELENELEDHRNKKSFFDSEINNIIILGKDCKQTPIYNGKKDWMSKPSRSGSSYKKGEQVRISGVRFYMSCARQKVYARKLNKNRLYHLSEYDLFKDHIKRTSSLYGKLINPDMERITFKGGIKNTPILTFRCSRSYNHKGKLYYLNLETNELYSKWSDARDAANKFCQNWHKDFDKDS
tara:strand:- start:2589 stop:3440 length:852 start_codon:yes stop_codon:yes gene_type:complete